MATEIQTELIIPHPPEEVWGVLTDLPAYGDWNPMAREARGALALGESLTLRLSVAPVPVKATIRALVPERELRWGGGVPALLDIEHYFISAPHEEGTRFVHGEIFGGLLGPLLVKLAGLDERMYAKFNRKLAERVASLQVAS